MPASLAKCTGALLCLAGAAPAADAECADFAGIVHSHDAEVCCAASCGDYCGKSNCGSGPGGHDACCKSHIEKNAEVCGIDVQVAPCMLPSSPPSPPLPPTPPTPALIDDGFEAYDDDTWIYADEKYVSQFAPGYYLKNHTAMNARLSLGEGQGLVMTMSNEPCHWDQKASCKGAIMASSHLQTRVEHSFGDYEARLRAPHVPGGDTCHEGIYGYFTAGYSKHDGVQNEINFGFHPDRDQHGTHVSCESHADTGKYRETNVKLGDFNVRGGFHTYMLRLRPSYVEWFVDGASVHKEDEQLSHLMHTSFILRTNKDIEMPTAIMEWGHFRFTPYDEATEVAV